MSSSRWTKNVKQSQLKTQYKPAHGVSDPDQGPSGVRRTVWFEGLTITLEEGGDTLLTGEVVDQAALYGLLKKVRDLGMPLLSINQNDSTS
jgi:hypothetical protein